MTRDTINFWQMAGFITLRLGVQVPLSLLEVKRINTYMKEYVYTVYKITNMLNLKFYIGVHKTKYPNDGYFGSGEGIKEAIKKYGKAAFQKEILFVFDNSEDAYIKESEIVTVDLVKSANCYNRHVGGFGKGIMVANALGLNNKNKPLDHMDKVRAGFNIWAKHKKDNPKISDDELLEAYEIAGSINAAVRYLKSNSRPLRQRLSKLVKDKFGTVNTKPGPRKISSK